MEEQRLIELHLFNVVTSLDFLFKRGYTPKDIEQYVEDKGNILWKQETLPA